MPHAQIHSVLSGRTVEAVFTDGRALVVRTTDCHEVRIIWRTVAGEDVPADGEPVLAGVSVRLALPALPFGLGLAGEI